MDTTALIVWQSFLQTSSLGHETLLRNISPKLASSLNQSVPVSFNPREGLEPLEEELAHIHSSWLSPLLRTFAETEIKLFLSSLTSPQIKSLKQTLLLSNTLPSLSSLGTDYLRKTLFQMIAKDDLIPIRCLPDDPLNALFDLTFAQLHSMIELLSMHDLSVEIRQIIETAKLKQIYGMLTKAQTTFLKTLLHTKEPVTFKKMGLLGWNGDRDSLSSMLMQRGVNRIAKSLYGKHSSLLWYVAHRLDSELGTLLLKLCTPLDHPRACPLLCEQVMELINALKTPNPLQNP